MNLFKKVLSTLFACVAMALVFYAHPRDDASFFLLGGIVFVLLVLSWTIYPLKPKAD